MPHSLHATRSRPRASAFNVQHNRKSVTLIVRPVLLYCIACLILFNLTSFTFFPHLILWTLCLHLLFSLVQAVHFHLHAPFYLLVRHSFPKELVAMRKIVRFRLIHLLAMDEKSLALPLMAINQRL
jgi:hypothetical protein